MVQFLKAVLNLLWQNYNYFDNKSSLYINRKEWTLSREKELWEGIKAYKNS